MPKERLRYNEMSKLLILLLVVLIAVGAVLFFTVIKPSIEDSQPQDIYTIANNSTATVITTKVGYKSPDGEDFSGWYVAKREGNNMIIEYEYDRYQTVEESVANGSIDRKVKEDGTVYYYNGAYYDDDDSSMTPWLGSPMDINFKFNLDKSKLSGIGMPDENRLNATMTAEACKEMFGITIDCQGVIALYITTNGVQLTEMQMVYTTASGATVTVYTTYSYNDIVLDFSDITGEVE